MVLFVGLVPVADRMRESFQEFDPYAWFGTQTKRVFVLDEASRASEVVAEAFFAARSGRPGPVVIGLPEDILEHEFTGSLHPEIGVTEGAISAKELDRLAAPPAVLGRPALDPGSGSGNHGVRRNQRHPCRAGLARSRSHPVILPRECRLVGLRPPRCDSVHV